MLNFKSFLVTEVFFLCNFFEANASGISGKCKKIKKNVKNHKVFLANQVGEGMKKRKIHQKGSFYAW